jgi:LacI family transcriptional regulator
MEDRLVDGDRKGGSTGRVRARRTPTRAAVALPAAAPSVPSVDRVSGPRLRNVAILIETSGAFGRGLLRGVAKYNRERTGWSTYFHPQGLDDPPPRWLAHWGGDGILARIGTPAMADMLGAVGLPVVNMRLHGAGHRFPFVGLDHSAVARTAAEYLLSLGLKQFGFYGYAVGNHAGLDERATAFAAAIAAAGRPCAVRQAGGGPAERDWDSEQASLAEWVAALPKPVGLMASNDVPGLFLLDACRRANLRVPDEVAVIGVDNDEHLCELAVPPLSSVDVNSERIGYDAAALLDRLMSSTDPAAPVDAVRIEPVRIGPRGVVVRRSTDVIASDDPEVNRAVGFIRANGGRALSVGDVLAHTNMSRGVLQQRMKRVLGHTIHEEIERVRLARVKELLLRSDMTIKRVMAETGFSSVQYMTRAFRTTVGETPARYRQARRQ